MTKIQNTLIYNKIRRLNEKIWQKRLQRRNKNYDFTIISNNCIGGIIYQNLGLRFNTPTINLDIEGEDYLNFIKNLKYYANCKIKECHREEYLYPIGKIISTDNKHKDIEVHFMHYKTFEEAKNKWEERFKRINYNNIYYIWEFYDNKYDISLIKEFDKLPINKMIILHRDIEEIKNKTIVSCYKTSEDVAKIMAFKGMSGKRNLDEFDYVKWLNEGREL